MSKQHDCAEPCINSQRGEIVIYYQNISYATKTFYGIEFKPQSVHAVPGYINAKNMIRVERPPVELSKEPSKKILKESAEKHEVVKQIKQELKQGGNSDGPDKNQ